MDNAQTQITVASFGQRNANGSRGPFTVYEINDTNGITWQAKKNVWDQMIQLVGQTVTVLGSVKQNNGYTNYYVNDLPGASVAPPAFSPAANQGFTQPNFNSPAIATSGTNVTFAPPVDTKQESIHRQVAAKVAAKISANSSEFWSNAADLFVYFQTGNTPLSAQVANAFPDAKPVLNEEFGF